MEQKFIDKDGLKVLWNQISLKDYPNNETLMAVIDAIDETKANKDEIVQADWNQTDENKLDYIKNKPFYEKDNRTAIILDYQTFNGFNQWDEQYACFDINLNLNFQLEVGKNYTVNWDGVEYITELKSEDGGWYLGFNPYCPEYDYPFGIWFSVYANVGGTSISIIDSIHSTSSDSSHTISIYEGTLEIKQIDEKFLPKIGVESWNDLKDKPFSTEISKIDLIEEQTITLDSNGHGNCVCIDNFWDYAFVGTAYEIEFDGEVYTGTMYEDGDMCMRTDFTTSNGVNVYMYNGNGISSSSALAGEHTIKMSVLAEKVTKIDDKYINFPVKSVNGKTDIVWISPDDIGAANVNDLKLKMDKENPTGTGSFSLNRKAGSTKGQYSFAEGYNTTASGKNSHAEGENTKASSTNSHAEGENTKASSANSHAEGYKTEASDYASHAEGYKTKASGRGAHAEGYVPDSSSSETITVDGKTYNIYTLLAEGTGSHAEGCSTIAKGKYSHAQGQYTFAYGEGSNVQGKYNIIDTEDKYAHIVGNGTSNSSRSNAHTLDWEGNAWFSGDIYVGSTSGINKDEGSKKLATEEYVDNNINSTVAIKTFPISETYTSGIFTFARTNIFELIKNQVYHTIPVEGIDGWYLSVPCTDGTFKNICLLSAGSEYRVLYDDTKANVYSFNDNVYYLADYTDKSTSSAVIITKTKNYYYLSTNNTTEYTPTGDYNPATKKYVDNAVANAGGGVQSDWNQNDETASDYVKNRPFYTENEGEITEIVPETTFTIDNEGMWYSEEFAIPIEAGNTYICKYNGVEYICTAFGYTQDGIEWIFLGNMGKAGADFEDTGEPFVIVTIPVDNMTMVILHDGTVSTDITCSITMNNEIIHKLPNKYLDLDWKPTKEYKLTDVFPINNLTFTGKEITLIDSQVFYLHVGEEYTVNWNGTEYVCEAKRIDADPFSIFYIGNTELASLTNKEDTGEPFIYIYFATHANTNTFYARLIKSNSTKETITFSVKGYTDVYNKMPTNFLPDSYVIPTDIDAGLVINELSLADKAFQEGRRVYARKGGVFGQVIYLGFDSVDGIFNQMWFVSDNKMFYIWSYEYGSTNGVAKTNYIVVGLVPDISGTRGYSVPVPSEMKAGQMVRLKSIDESKASGYNMAWEAVDPWVIESSTAGSTKKFKLTVDDSGTISTTEVTE